jgi:GTP-dependent phosphoenolpyruvate carboxykinase
MIFALFGFLMLSGNYLLSGSSATATRLESAVVEFAENVKVRDVILRGEYLFVHDEERMAKGEPCTYIYRGKQQDETKLVASFHCIHVDREMVSEFKATITKRVTPYDVAELTEIQFAGSKDGHRVP